MTYKEAALLDKEKIFSEFSSGQNGLAATAAAGRMLKSARPPRPINAAVIFFRQIKSPMFLILAAALTVSLLATDWSSALAVAFFLAINAVLGFVQEYRSEHIVRKLEKIISPLALVRRDGKKIRIRRDEIVTGDLVIIRPGDVLPADGRLTVALNLLIDESLLTGESAPAEKTIQKNAVQPGAPAEAGNIGFAGTTVVSGHGEMVVFAIQKDTVFGLVAAEAGEIKRPSLFEQNINAFSKYLVKVVIVTLGVVLIANLIIKGNEGNFFELMLFSLALAVSVVPEALPAIIAVTFSKGAMLLAKKKVVIKRLSSIEDLGQVEVLCTDKTGTITENRLAVGRIASHDHVKMMLAALYSSECPRGGENEPSSFDAAIWHFSSEELRQAALAAPCLREFPFDPKRRRNGMLVEVGKKRILSIKGAPESVLELCVTSVEEKKKILDEFAVMGKEGMRVLAVASREVPVKENYGLADEKGAEFLGLIAFTDPLKKTAKDAIALAEKLNVRVKILTGDSLEVAAAVGIEAGIIKSPEFAVSGAALEALDEDNLAAAAKKYDVFARLTPELKHRIVDVLEHEYTVGFLGEGINDAPALKAANVALVVAEASDVAREAADVVLLDRSLAVIVDGIREGRMIFANVQKYIRYTLVCNMGNFYSLAIISLFMNFLPLLPKQILLLNILSDLPLLAIATDLVDLDDIAAPRRFSMRDLAIMAGTLGLVSSLFDFIFFGLFRNFPESILQTLWFWLSLFTEIFAIFSLRTEKFFLKVRRPSFVLIGLAVFSLFIAVVAPFTAIGRNFFGFTTVAIVWFGIIVFLAIAYLAANEAAKSAFYRFWRRMSAAKG